MKKGGSLLFFLFASRKRVNTNSSSPDNCLQSRMGLWHDLIFLQLHSPVLEGTGRETQVDRGENVCTFCWQAISCMTSTNTCVLFLNQSSGYMSNVSAVVPALCNMCATVCVLWCVCCDVCAVMCVLCCIWCDVCSLLCVLQCVCWCVCYAVWPALCGLWCVGCTEEGAPSRLLLWSTIGNDRQWNFWGPELHGLIWFD